MAFPDPIRLAAGNAIHVDVVFRPVIYEPYDDMIEFHTPTVRTTACDPKRLFLLLFSSKIVSLQGNFFVRVVATVKQLVVALPEMMDFNFVAVNELAQRQIEIHNIGVMSACNVATLSP